MKKLFFLRKIFLLLFLTTRPSICAVFLKSQIGGITKTTVGSILIPSITECLSEKLYDVLPNRIKPIFESDTASYIKYSVFPLANSMISYYCLCTNPLKMVFLQIMNEELILGLSDMIGRKQDRPERVIDANCLIDYGTSLLYMKAAGFCLNKAPWLYSKIFSYAKNPITDGYLRYSMEIPMQLLPLLTVINFTPARLNGRIDVENQPDVQEEVDVPGNNQIMEGYRLNDRKILMGTSWLSLLLLQDIVNTGVLQNTSLKSLLPVSFALLLDYKLNLIQKIRIAYQQNFNVIVEDNSLFGTLFLQIFVALYVRYLIQKLNIKLRFTSFIPGWKDISQGISPASRR